MHTFFCEHLVGLRVTLNCKCGKPYCRLLFEMSFWSTTKKAAENKSYVKVERAWCGCCNTAVVRYLPPFEGVLSPQYKNISLADHPPHQQTSQQQPERLSLWQQLCRNTRTRRNRRKSFSNMNIRPGDQSSSLSLKKQISFRQAVKSRIALYPCKVLPESN